VHVLILRSARKDDADEAFLIQSNPAGRGSNAFALHRDPDGLLWIIFGRESAEETDYLGDVQPAYKLQRGWIAWQWFKRVLGVVMAGIQPRLPSVLSECH
jgi:hypothetical protein